MRYNYMKEETHFRCRVRGGIQMCIDVYVLVSVNQLNLL